MLCLWPQTTISIGPCGEANDLPQDEIKKMIHHLIKNNKKYNNDTVSGEESKSKSYTK